MSGPEPGTVWDTYANGSGRHWLEDRLAQPFVLRAGSPFVLRAADLTWDYGTVLDTLHGGEDLNIEAPGAAVLPVLRPACIVPDGWLPVSWVDVLSVAVSTSIHGTHRRLTTRHLADTPHARAQRRWLRKVNRVHGTPEGREQRRVLQEQVLQRNRRWGIPDGVISTPRFDDVLHLGCEPGDPLAAAWGTEPAPEPEPEPEPQPEPEPEPVPGDLLGDGILRRISFIGYSREPEPEPEPEPAPRPDALRCRWCGKTDAAGARVKKCGGCLSACYCDAPAPCQLRDWKQHRLECKGRAARKQLHWSAYQAPLKIAWGQFRRAVQACQFRRLTCHIAGTPGHTEWKEACHARLSPREAHLRWHGEDVQLHPEPEPSGTRVLPPVPGGTRYVDTGVVLRRTDAFGNTWRRIAVPRDVQLHPEPEPSQDLVPPGTGGTRVPDWTAGDRLAVDGEGWGSGSLPALQPSGTVDGGGSGSGSLSAAQEVCVPCADVPCADCACRSLYEPLCVPCADRSRVLKQRNAALRLEVQGLRAREATLEAELTPPQPSGTQGTGHQHRAAVNKRAVNLDFDGGLIDGWRVGGLLFAREGAADPPLRPDPLVRPLEYPHCLRGPLEYPHCLRGLPGGQHVPEGVSCTLSSDTGYAGHRDTCSAAAHGADALGNLVHFVDGVQVDAPPVEGPPGCWRAPRAPTLAGSGLVGSGSDDSDALSLSGGSGSDDYDSDDVD